MPDTLPAPAGTLNERQAQIAAAARALLDAEGPEALTMRRIAGVLGIKAPSLYKHLPDKAALEALVVAAGFAELAAVLADAAAAAAAADGADRDDAADATGKLTAIAGAYRAYAVAHPHLYRLMNYQPLRRDLLPGGLEARAAQPLAEAAGYDEARARAMWAFAHGMVSLEIDGRFPPRADLDEAWRAGLAAFAPPAAFHHRSRGPGALRGNAGISRVGRRENRGLTARTAGKSPRLFPGGCLELGDEFGRDAAAVFDVDSLSPGPFADFGGVRGPGGLLPGATRTGPGAAGGADVGGQHIAQLLGVAGAEVNLIFGAVHAESYGALGLAAVEVIDKKGFDLLRHGYRSSGDLAASRNKLSPHACASAIFI